MNYYIADPHLGHENVIKFSHRPFASADEMDKCLMDSWNSRITDSDDIFILGDLIVRSHNSFDYYLDRLNGHKHLIEGNHDGRLLNDTDAVKKLESVDQFLSLKDGDYKLFLCHYPVAEWYERDKGRLQFFGHIHNLKLDATEYMNKVGNAYNVGVDIIGPTPLTAKEIIEGYTTPWDI